LTAGQDSSVELSAGFDAAVDLTAAYDAPVELTAGLDAVVEPELVSPAALVQPDPEPELVVAPTVVEAEVFQLTAPDESTPSWSLAELAIAEALVDAGPSIVAAEAVEIAQALDFETEPEPEIIVAPVVAAVIAPVVEAAVAPVLAEVVAFAKVAEPVRQERPRSPLPALERFLAGVHARRRQLMAESVA
jgi:hypothetical protein